MIDAKFKSTPVVSDIPKIEDWCDRLVKKLNMEVFFPSVVKYDSTIGNEGISLIGMLTTSHFSAHFFNHNKKMKFDCYSCKPYEIETCIKLIEEFNPTELTWMFVDRSDDKFEIKATGKKYY